MALNTHSRVSDDAVDDFDPFSPIDVQPVHPVWTTTPAELARNGDLSYDRLADTFFAKRPNDYAGGVVVEVGDVRIARYVITDMETGVVVALMVEGFLIRAVREAPALFDELERAELRGITIEEVRELRRLLADEAHGPGPTLAEFYAPEAWLEPVVDEDEGTR